MHAADRSRLALRLALCIALIPILVTPSFADDDTPEQQFGDRTFTSDLPLRVVAVVKRGTATPDCIVGTRHIVGTTPSKEPLAIPRCFLWFVEPVDPAIEDDVMPALAKELKAQSIPGLSLEGCAKLTDRGVKSLASLKTLVYLGIRGTLISSDGMAKLKALPALRFLDGRPGALMGLPWAKKFKNLELADFSQHRTLQGPELKALRGLKHLRALRLNQLTFLTDRSMEELVKLKQLRELEIGFCRQVTAAGVEALAALRGLESLCIDSIQVTDDTVAALATMPALTALRMRGSHAVTDVALAHLAKLEHLRRLDIRNCYQLTDAGLPSLKALKELQALALQATRGITDKGLATVGSLTTLEELELSHSSITDEGLAHLANLTQLTSLDLREAGVTDAGLAHLKKFTVLRTLVLLGCEGVSDPGIEDLVGLPLETLDLGGTSVGDLALVYVGQIKSIETLLLAKAESLADDGLAELSALERLRTLDLSGVPSITDAAVVHLAKLTSLRTLNLTDTGFTIRGVRALREALPECSIEH